MTFIVFDAEYAVDCDAHGRYLAAERVDPATLNPFDERDPKVSPR